MTFFCVFSTYPQIMCLIWSWPVDFPRDQGRRWANCFPWKAYAKAGHWVGKLHRVSWYSAPPRFSVVSYFWNWKPAHTLLRRPCQLGSIGVYQREILRWDQKMGGKKPSCVGQHRRWECGLPVLCFPAAAEGQRAGPACTHGLWAARLCLSFLPSCHFLAVAHIWVTLLPFLICTLSPSNILKSILCIKSPPALPFEMQWFLFPGLGTNWKVG